MTNYARMYRFGFTPWERYRTAAAASIAARKREIPQLGSNRRSSASG